jgi:hypothetical protein
MLQKRGQHFIKFIVNINNIYLFERPLWKLTKYSPNKRERESLKRKCDPDGSDKKREKDV